MDFMNLSPEAYAMFLTSAAGIRPDDQNNWTVLLGTRLCRNNLTRAEQQALHLKLVQKMWENQKICVSITMAFEFDNELNAVNDINIHGHILCVMNGEPEQIESFLKDMDTYSIEQCWMDERVKTNDTSNGEHYGFWYNIVSTKPRKI